MRQAGTIPHQADACRLVDYLLTQGIEAKADTLGDEWAIWIYDENRLAESKAEFAAFQANPADPRYEGAARKATSLRREKAAAQRKSAGKVIDARQRWATPVVRATPVTLTLITVSVLIGIMTGFGRQLGPVEPYLFIARIHLDGDAMSYQPGLQEVRHGQLWRLVTPILIHMDLLHLLFNMMWLWVFGRAIESRRGSVRFMLLVVAGAAISNLAQYAYRGPELILFGHETAGGPYFGGMSGVNYALFGYCWIRSEWVRSESPYLDSRTTFMFLVWFVVCFTGAVGPVANIAHAAGLLVGAMVAFVPSLIPK